jgi:putative hydrolase of the HAD superfamily
MAKPLLLDFGGPVLKTPFELRHIAEPTLGPLAWAGPFATDHVDVDYQRWQSGEITERTFWADRALQYGLDTKSFMRLFYEPAGEHLTRPEMVNFIANHQAKGTTVGVLTNDMQAFHGPEWMSGVPVIATFDFIVDGSITGVLKPDPQSFAFALKELGEPDPSDVIFVDDQHINLRGAEAVGLTAVFFDPTDPPGSMKRIEEALAA